MENIKQYLKEKIQNQIKNIEAEIKKSDEELEIFEMDLKVEKKILEMQDVDMFLDAECKEDVKYSIEAIENMFTMEGSKNEELKKDLKERCLKSFEIYFHQAKADINCQLADYCGWAIAIKWERGESRSFDLIQNKVESEYEIFRAGDRTYYLYK